MIVTFSRMMESTTSISSGFKPLCLEIVPLWAFISSSAYSGKRNSRVGKRSISLVADLLINAEMRMLVSITSFIRPSDIFLSDLLLLHDQ